MCLADISIIFAPKIEKKGRKTMRLSELNTGEKGVIVKVLGHGGFRKRIVEMGFIKGKTVEVLLNAPLRDPIKYKVMGYEISLRRQEAEMIEIISEQEAKERHISIEMAARELRYAWFEKTREACSAAVIAVAHHQDDSVETLLLNLIRGTGINGLRGIRPRNGHIVRPLLCLDRKEITGYLESIGQSYVTDSTNLQDEYTRNKIRLNLLPMMQEINPSVKESILKTAEHLDDAASIYNIGIEEAKLRVKTPEGISIGALRQEAAPETVLFEILHPLGFNAAQVRDICRTLDGQPGKVFATPGWRVIKDRGSLLIEPVQEAVKPLLEMKEHPYAPDFMIPRDKATACFDADKLQHPLSLRLCRQGDSFVPFGMKGRKKVSDYLTDRKFSLLRKERQWVLCCGDDIIWLVGERVDNRFRIDEKTRKVLVVSTIDQ